MGGVPWSVSDLPYFNKPAMVIGYDTFSKRGQKDVLALCASINSTGNRFFSRVKQQNGEIG